MDLPLIERAKTFHNHTAFLQPLEQKRTLYSDLLSQSASIALELLGKSNDLHEERIAFLLPASPEYAAVQWGIWRAGGVAVPLNAHATVPELEHIIKTAGVSRVIGVANELPTLGDLPIKMGLTILSLPSLLKNNAVETRLPDVDTSRRAMILFTSGTTNKPKGVVSTHTELISQITALTQAWQWRAGDKIPLFLPMHHLHGILNILLCALWSGALIEPYAKFDVDHVCHAVAEKRYTLFMAVPTLYVKLLKWLQSHENFSHVEAVTAGFRAMRLMVSGSAALPASVHNMWQERTGQKLLERYGMTEIGMALSNPYDGDRRPGMVGMPLNNIDVRLVDDRGHIIRGAGTSGEIWVKGTGVFTEYFDNPAATEESFERGWFKTGDIGVLEDGYYRIMGRSSVDIIKSGGYKLSALEIEAVLLDHPMITACAIVGLPDDEWGEIVAAVIESSGTASPPLKLDTLQTWAKERLSPYKIPRKLLVVNDLPRNAMGKVTKPAVKDLFRL